MLKFAFGNLLSRSFRSLLALTGLAIAIAGMVALFSIAQGIDFVVQKTFAQIPGMTVQQRGAPVPMFSTLPAVWGEEIARLPGVHVVDSEIVQRLNIMEGKSLIAPPRFVVGFDLSVRPSLERDVYRENVTSGRFFTSEDVNTNHCLVSEQIAEETGKGIGDSIRLNDYTAEIIGVYHTGSQLLDVNILLDLNAVRDLMRIDAATVSFFYVETKSGSDQKQLQKQIQTLFRGRSVAAAKDQQRWNSWGQAAGWLISQLQNSSQSATGNEFKAATRTPSSKSVGDSADSPSEDIVPVEVRLASDWSDRFAEFTGDLKLFLLLITVMAVMIAVLSIVNTMSMSVSERMIEFGILRANGWSKWNIIQLMTWESGLLGLAGGVLGATLGWLTAVIVNSIYPDRLQLHASPGLLLFAVLSSTGLGILGGLYPSWLAANRSPMDAIRRG